MAGTARETAADLLADARSVIQRVDSEATWTDVRPPQLAVATATG
jgi:hypothetical protein